MTMKTYTYEEAHKSTLEYFFGDEFVTDTFLKKYLLKNKENEFVELNPDHSLRRLAGEFARIDFEKYNKNYQKSFDRYYDALKGFARVCAQGSPMSAIGNIFQVMSASNCVVVPAPKDSIHGIFSTGEQLAQLYKRRAGVGTDLSLLRPEKAVVNNAARTTTGAWSFADFYSHVTNMIGQKARRGALMLTMDVMHPDILKFAKCKHDITKVTGANISVKLFDEFMKAVESDSDFTLKWPVDSENPIISTAVKARDIWNEIIDSATKTADPGLMFIDTIKKNLPADFYEEFKTVTTNPCGEVPLSEFDSCRLMSINLTGYVRNAFKNDAYFDFVAFEKDVRTAMNMIDNLVDIEIELVEKIKSVCDSESEKEIWNKLQKSAIIGRRTGLGTHGLADTLAQLNIKYDSQESLVAVDNIYKNLRNFAYDESVELAIARGSFPVFNFELEKNCEFIKRLPEDLLNKIKKHGRRNISILTQAPTGTTSIISKSGQFNRYNISSGIEPVFRNSYTRRKKINPGDQNVRVDFVDEVGESWQEFKVFHSNAQNYLDINNLDENAVLPDIFVTSDQISWEKRVELQGIEQQYIDHSISATINLPKGTPPSLVSDIYMKAWKSGLKGITVYVEGSKSGVLVSEDQLASKDGRPAKIIPSHSPKRPKELSCEIHHATAKGSKWTILVGLMQGQPYEIFAGLSNKIHLPEKYKIGKIFKSTKGKYNLHVDIGADEDLIIEDIIQSFDNPESAWATRMISVSLRHGVPVEFICDQLSKDGFITDINKVLARVLKKYIKEGTKVTTNVVCPDCGGKDLVYSEGCIKCISCSYSKCG